MATPTSKPLEVALPSALLTAHPADWRLIGHGLLTWSVFRLYHAYLYVPAAAPDASAPEATAPDTSTSFDPDGDFVLMLRYLRNIPGEQIVSTSTEEIARLTDTPADELAAWTQAMRERFPDVAAGDRLTGWFRRGEGVRFFRGDTPAGDIDSPAFARAFAAIWLDPRTRSPALRANLLGLNRQDAA
ncbi:chalcone isomerase family protein [Achromobacter sp. PAB15]|uniref:chalcone isomerase family protein n=1 Tax=Achromobacter sp. PAB15 TaxID=3233048 RepID=UPI003F934B1A